MKRGRARQPRRWWAPLLLGALPLLASCGAGAPTPSVLLVTIDTLRADACGVAGLAGEAPVAATPRLAALAAAGTTFVAASTVTPLTLPAHASLLTGLRPARHGLTVNGVAVERLPVPTLAQTLAATGRATAAFVSASVLDRRYGLAVGFEHYDDELAHPGGPPVPTERRGDRTARRAADWLAARRAPFFAWVHLFDPHAPYAAPGGPAGRDRAAYLAEIAFADDQLGRLLDALDPARHGPVLVVVTSDHGEGLGEHGERTHGLLLHETTIHVPLVAAWVGTPPRGAPFAAPGTRRDDAVSLLDVPPTILGALGLRASADLDGEDVGLPRPGRALPLEARTAWFYYAQSPLAGVRRDHEKLVGAPRAAAPGWTAYDLAVDPREARPADGASHPLVRAVRSPEPMAEAEPAGSQELRALGYLGASAPPVSDGPLPDPRDALEMLGLLDDANTRLVAGDAPAARALAEEVLRRWGDVPEARFLLGSALRHEAAAASDPVPLLARAVETLEAAALARPYNAELLVELGLAALAHARATGTAPDAAARALDAALAILPADPHAGAWRALVDLEAGDPQRALARLDALARARAPDATVLRVRVEVLRALGRRDEAEALAARLAGARDGG